jgi:hypothetical protein
MKKLLLTWGIMAVIVLPSIFSGSSGLTAVPHNISYQGMVTDSEGNPVNGYHELIFKIYDNATGGNLLWCDSLYILIEQGLFSCVLGSSWSPLNLAFDQPYWLEVSVNYETMPRVLLTSVGYAYRAAVADSAVVAGSGGGGGGWVDDGKVIRLETSGDSVGIGTTTPAEKLDVNGGIKASGRIASTVSPGTAPLNVSSSTKCDSLNADMVDGVHAGSFTQIRAEGTVDAGNSTTLVIPNYILWTLQLASGWPNYGGVCFVQGFENDHYIGVTFTAYNGDGTSGAGGAEGAESSTTTLVSFGSTNYMYTVKCPGEAAGDHNIVLDASGSWVELRYRLIY